MFSRLFRDDQSDLKKRKLDDDDGKFSYSLLKTSLRDVRGCDQHGCYFDHVRPLSSNNKETLDLFDREKLRIKVLTSQSSLYFNVNTVKSRVLTHVT